MAGLLEFLNSPSGMGLLSAAAGGLAGARRGTPWNNVGRGAVSGLMGYSNAQDQIRADEENAFQKQFKQVQLDDYKRKAAEAEAQRAWRAGLPDYLRPQTKYVVGDQQFGSQQEAQAAAMPNENTQLMAGAMGSQAAAQPVQEINAVRDPEELQAYMMQPGSPYADKFIEGMIPKPPKWTMGERFNDATGLPEKVIYDENDPTKVMPFGGQKQNIPEGMRMANGRLEPIPGYVAMKTQIAAAGAPRTVTYGSPVPAFNPQTGKVELVQFGNKPGASPTPTGYEAPPTRANGSGPMSVTLQKELIEADDAVRSSAEVTRTLQSALKINNDAYSGYGAKTRAVVRSNLPFPSKEANATVDLDNMMTGQALESLKLVFGGMPTEGERKILLDMQASADKTPAQRKAIIDRAIAATQRRQQFAKSKAEAIRKGTYLTEGAAPPEEDKPANNAGGVPAGVDPAIWQHMTPEERKLWQ